MELLQWLENWYASMCDGDWEHFYGVKIDTLDNPGWTVSIDISGTPLESRHFEPVHDFESDNDWLHCVIEDGKFDGCGDHSKLTTILTIFKNWVERDN